MTPAQRSQKLSEQRILGQRLRRRRLESGLSQTQAARASGQPDSAWRLWEVGTHPYPARKLVAMAAALGVPIASLLVDQLVLAEIRVSDETLERVRRDGWPAAEEVAERLAKNLAALLMAEVSRPPVDLSPGARAKPRRTREQLLARKAEGIEMARRTGTRDRPRDRRVA